MNRSDAAFAAWNGRAEAAQGIRPEWPTTGIAIEGDFSGIQRFVLRPVPGAGGAGRRLRARSFRVLALTRLAAAWVESHLARAGAQLFYSAGGRFLLVARPCSDWSERLAAIQGELDEFLLTAYRGELVFHLAGAEFADGKIPVGELGNAMNLRKLTPLRGALQSAHRWAMDRFTRSAGNESKCQGCGSTAPLYDDDSELLCHTCIDDRELGKQLLARDGVALARSAEGRIDFAGERWKIAANGDIRIPYISHAPLTGQQLADFDELAKRALGRPYLAYLHIDADRIGVEFNKLEGNPCRVWGLSRLLDEAFSSGIDALLRTRFRNLYPVYGGGDDLFLIGPWNEVLDFAAAWRTEFRELTSDRLTFSAGVALAKPRQHILTKSEEAASALDDEAKKERNSIHALGETIGWDEFDGLYSSASELASLHAQGRIKSAFLHDVILLRDLFKKGDARWHPLLSYQIERNLTGEVKSFAKRAFLLPGNLWKHAGFAARYAMLKSGETAPDSAP